MKVFILGRPQSGKTTMAKAVCQCHDYHYVDGDQWLRNSFRRIQEKEHPDQYEDAYHQYLTGRLVADSDLCLNHLKSQMSDRPSLHYVIDSVVSPRDFVSLFDYTQDLVVFLNRSDEDDLPIKDYQKIGVSVLRDYCFWLASAGLLTRDRWHEYNFRMSGQSNKLKVMGSKNSVFIVGTLDRAISHLKESIV
jgi:hypothetical protein